MKDILTKKERETVERVRADLPDSGEFGFDGELIAIIDKLETKLKILMLTKQGYGL
jgi:hypothetical protein